MNHVYPMNHVYSMSHVIMTTASEHRNNPFLAFLVCMHVINIHYDCIVTTLPTHQLFTLSLCTGRIVCSKMISLAFVMVVVVSNFITHLCTTRSGWKIVDGGRGCFHAVDTVLAFVIVVDDNDDDACTCFVSLCWYCFISFTVFRLPLLEYFCWSLLFAPVFVFVCGPSNCCRMCH